MRLLTSSLISVFLLISLNVSAADHLEPVDPHPSKERLQRYDEMTEHLKLWYTPYVQMLAEPSFSGACSVRIEYMEDPGKFEEVEEFPADLFLPPVEGASSKPAEVKKVKVQAFKKDADGKPSLFMVFRAEKRSYGPPPDEEMIVTVSEDVAECPRQLAERLLNLWKQMLGRMRYPVENTNGCDGTTYEFTNFAWWGKTWTPTQENSTYWLVNLGERMIEHCQAPHEKRGATMKAIEDHCTALEGYLKAHP